MQMSVKQVKHKPGTWLIDYRPNGRHGKRIQREYTGTEADALALEMDLRRQSRRQTISVNPKLSAVMPDWLEEYRNNHLPNTIRDCKNCMVHLVPFFGGFYFAEISPPIIEQYKRMRLDTLIIPARRKGEGDKAYQERAAIETRHISKRTIEKELTYLSSFLTWSAEHHHTDPLPFRIKKFPRNQTKAALAKPLHPDELNAVIAAIEPAYVPILLLMADLGLRRSEALTLTAESVDLKSGLIYVLGKGNKERLIPITSDRLRAALTAAKKQTPKGYLFTNPKTEKPWYTIRKALLRAAAAAGIERRVYHHLCRHTFGTQAMSGRLGLRTVQKMMGHATSKTTELYTQLADSLMTAEAARFNAYLKATSTPDVKDASEAAQEAAEREDDDN